MTISRKRMSLLLWGSLAPRVGFRYNPDFEPKSRRVSFSPFSVFQYLQTPLVTDLKPRLCTKHFEYGLF
jgi:hypothetical protein